jgi:hypothetical protein
MPLVGIGTLPIPLSRHRVFPSPQKQGGEGTLACGWGVGGSPNSDEGHTLWYSLYVRTLCSTVLLGFLPKYHILLSCRAHLLLFYAYFREHFSEKKCFCAMRNENFNFTLNKT